MIGLVLFCAACSPLPEAVPIDSPSSCTVTDGDTIRCGEERIRLLAIDAPEMGGRCRAGRVCVEGDPVASREHLRAAITGGPLTIRRMGKDRYGRTLAVVYAGGTDLSCLQISAGHAQYVARWDNKRAVAHSCKAAD